MTPDHNWPIRFILVCRWYTDGVSSFLRAWKCNRRYAYSAELTSAHHVRTFVHITFASVSEDDELHIVKVRRGFFTFCSFWEYLICLFRGFVQFLIAKKENERITGKPAESSHRSHNARIRVRPTFLNKLIFMFMQTHAQPSVC